MTQKMQKGVNVIVETILAVIVAVVIGGGAGYASYNNSVGDNVKTISNSLKQLIQLQQSNVDRLVNTLEDIKVTGAGTWGD